MLLMDAILLGKWPVVMVQSGMTSQGHFSRSHGADLALALDRDDPRPLPTQIADQVRAAALTGRLTPGTRLPSTRRLAADLGVARGVAEAAWDQLRAEGWLVSRTGSGSWLTTSPLPAAPGRTPRREPAPEPEPEPLVMMDAGTPWRGRNPALEALWRRAWREVSMDEPPRAYEHAAGLPQLRELLAERMGRTRGMALEARDVLVTSGTVAGFRQVVSALPQGVVAVEDPGYRSVVHSLAALGRSDRSLPVGAPPESLAGCVAAYVTPAHQHPTGRVMPAGDRLELLRVARRDGCVVIEDDYDSEFRYDVAPLPALAAWDRDRVAYLGTASKTVLPSLRLGWAVVPPPLHDAVLRSREVTFDVPPWPVQRAMVTLLRDGYVDHLARAARRAYAERARLVSEALSPHLQACAEVAGMYSTWACPEPVARRVRDAALAAGFRINLLSDYCRRSEVSGLLIGFGGPSDAELVRALDVIRRALEQA